MSQKIGLCLTGGGGRGAYQVGAMTALKDAGIFEHIECFSGTSIGSANLAIALSRSMDVAKDIWFNIPPDSLKTEESLFKKFTHERLKAIDMGIYSMDQFEDLMIREINFDVLRTFDVYVTVAEGGETGEGILALVKSTYEHYVKRDSKVLYLPLKELTDKEIHKAIVASCSIPMIFPPVNVDHKKYYDGGVFDNIPIKPLMENGCDEIIILHLNKTFIFNVKKYPEVKFHEIKHHGNMGGVLDFSVEHSQKLFAFGYQDMMTYLEQLETPII